MPTDEIFDVVDADDRVIGQLPRAEVHRLGLRHRATHVLVFNARGELFLQQRSLAKDMWPGVWDSSCSGHVDSGEDYDTSATRELGEEIGVHGATPTRWFRIEACAETAQEFCWVYRLRHDGPFVLHPEEIERGEWLAPDELARKMAARPEDYCSAFTLIWSRVKAGKLI